MSSEQSSERVSWLLFLQVEALGTRFCKLCLESFLCLPLGPDFSQHRPPESRLSLFNLKVWTPMLPDQKRFQCSLETTSRMDYTWPHVTDHSPKSSTLKIVYTISFSLGVYEWHLNLCFIFGYHLKDNSLYMHKHSKLEMKSKQDSESSSAGPAQTPPFPASWTILEVLSGTWWGPLPNITWRYLSL